MPVSMLVRCEKCGYENFPQHRFCGMCAAELRLPGPGGSQPAPSPQRVSPPPVSLRPLSQTSSPPARATREEVTAQKVSGPSFLGLENEPADSRSLSYLLEDETPQHRGRNLILIVLLAAVAAAGWHWRQDLRIVASRLLSSPPPVGSAQDANSPPAADSASQPASANGASTDNKVQQPAQAPAGQSSDQTATPPAQVPPAGTAGRRIRRKFRRRASPKQISRRQTTRRPPVSRSPVILHRVRRGRRRMTREMRLQSALHLCARRRSCKLNLV